MNKSEIIDYFSPTCSRGERETWILVISPYNPFCSLSTEQKNESIQSLATLLQLLHWYLIYTELGSQQTSSPWFCTTARSLLRFRAAASTSSISWRWKCHTHQLLTQWCKLQKRPNSSRISKLVGHDEQRETPHEHAQLSKHVTDETCKAFPHCMFSVNLEDFHSICAHGHDIRWNDWPLAILLDNKYKCWN
jgi:hypothetical protein